MNDGKMQGLQIGLESALAESVFPSLLNDHFSNFPPIFFYKCQTLLPGIAIFATDDGNINGATER